MTDETVAVDVAPLDLMTQKEQVNHVNAMHLPNWQINSKSRKEVIEKWHAQAHLDGNLRHPHTHTHVPSEEERKSGAALETIDVTKPLKATERKALRDLVDNDFLALKAEINQFADDMAAARREEVTYEFAERGSDAAAFVERGKEIVAEFRSARAKLISEANHSGVELDIPALYKGDNVTAKVVGLPDAIKAATASVQADRKRALNTLERARLTAQRKVLMTGVTAEALAILDEIPTARELMLQAAQERPAELTLDA